MRNFVAVLLASAITALAALVLSHVYGLVFLDRRFPVFVFDGRLFELWAAGAIGIFFVNYVVGLPIVALLKHLRVLSLPIVTAAGAAAGVALCWIILLLPSSDRPVAQTLSQQLMPWLLYAVLGALSAAVLGYMVMPGSNSTVDGDARKSSARE